MMPCSPPIDVLQYVGQASRHTACVIGPSTIDRSNREGGPGGVVEGSESGRSAGTGTMQFAWNVLLNRLL